MKGFLLKLLTGMILAVLFSFCPGARADAELISKTLDEDMRITPPGIIVTTADDIPMFKKGTVVMLNEYGEVLKGTLAKSIYLPYATPTPDLIRRTATYIPPFAPHPPVYTPPPQIIPYTVPHYVTDTRPQNRALPFKGGTEVIFNDKGEVIKGTISSSGESIDINPANYILVSSGEISFHKNGMVTTCTLAKDSYLRPVGWPQILTENYTASTACSGLVKFKGKKPIELNEKGEVVKGTLKEDTRLLYAPDDSRKKVYEAGTTVEFDDKGVVVKASK